MMRDGGQPRGARTTPLSLAAMFAVSLALHALLFATAFLLMGFVAAERYDWTSSIRVSIASGRLPRQNLPPLSGSKDAGPSSTPARAVQAPQEKKEEPKPEPQKEPEKREEKPRVEQPKPKAEQRSDLETEKAKKTEPSDSVKIPALGAEEKPAEEPPRETARQLRERLEGSTGLYKAPGRGAAGGPGGADNMALVGDPGGGVPDNMRNQLAWIIGENWRPPLGRTGQVREAVVEFVLVSNPLSSNSTRTIRERARLGEIKLIKSSGDPRFDESALQAIGRLRYETLPPFPQYIDKSRLTVACRFYHIEDESKENR